ncbi:MAG: hypothetical protein JW818_19170 [Pirellulales bacterium]|nr:hypothetical protein [Pirellulales bacterium]
MSLFEDDRYRWRETYFVQFPARNRPSLDKLCQTLSMVGERLKLTSEAADEQGLFESLTVVADDDFSALDISYLSGPEVLAQGVESAEQFEVAGCSKEDREKLKRLRQFDGRFDVLHFERVTDFEDEDEPEGMLDPSALLLVLDALAELTEGIAVDPQTGTIF